MFSTLFDIVWIRFCVSGTLVTAFWVTEVLARRTGAPAEPRWAKPVVLCSVLGFNALIGPTGGTLLLGLGNGAGIALADAGVYQATSAIETLAGLECAEHVLSGIAIRRRRAVGARRAEPAGAGLLDTVDFGIRNSSAAAVKLPERTTGANTSIWFKSTADYSIHGTVIPSLSV